MTKEYRVQGSSSVYTVKENDGKMTCYAASGALCPAWKNSRGEKDCKHCRAARRGDVIRGAADHAADVDAGRGPAKATRADVAFAESKPMPQNGERFVKPMLASTMDSATITAWHEWAIEEKFDGHRAIVMVVGGDVTAWSRSGKTRSLPSHVEAAFRAFPNGLYDGELMGREGGNFADVRRVETQHEAYFVVFDVLNVLGDNVMGRAYAERRELLGRVFEAAGGGDAVRCAESVDVTCEADVVKFVSKVWERGGEGAILKRRASRYQAGARSKDFVKVKKLATEVVTVVGFEASKGKIDNRGAFAVVAVRADDGVETTVKTKNAEELRRLEREWAGADPIGKHPAIGRRLRIEYAYRDATSNAFVNPRWDRWEDE